MMLSRNRASSAAWHRCETLMNDIEKPAAPPAAEVAPFDPAAVGCSPTATVHRPGRPVLDAVSGDSHRYAFMAGPNHNRRGIVRGGADDVRRPRDGHDLLVRQQRQPQATVQLDMHFMDAVQIGSSSSQVPRRAPDALAGVHERRARGRRTRGGDRQRRGRRWEAVMRRGPRP
jgi:hypothetical protein